MASPLRTLTRLTTPDRSRWQPMLVSLGVALAGIHAVRYYQPSEPISGLLALLVLGAWAVGACAFVGYVRWWFASEIARGKEDK